MSKKSKKKSEVLLQIFKIFYVLFQIGIFAVTWLEAQDIYFWSGKTTIVLVVVFATFLLAFLMTYSAFDINKTKTMDLCVKHMLSLGLSDFIIFAIIVIALKHLPDVSDIVFMVPVQVAVTVIWCMLARKLHFMLHPAAEAMVVYYDERAFEPIKPIYKDTKNYHVIKTINLAEYEGDMSLLKEILTEAEVVFLCGISIQNRNDIFKFLIENNKKVVVRPSIGDVLVSTAEREYICNVPVLTYSSADKSMMTLFMKRLTDIVASALMLLVASPVMLCVALAIKLEDKGPVFYKQKRLTKDAKVFEIIKFRSMRVDAEKDGVARLASDNDSRITKVGKIIRATRLDELPQLINILKGEMSLIGPRPERPEIAAEYEKDMPEFALRLQVKAGLTGYAQVYGKYNTPPYDKVQMDLMYIANQNILEDIKLMLITFKILFIPSSTEGVSENQKTAKRESEK